MEIVRVLNNKKQLVLQPADPFIQVEEDTTTDVHFMAANTIPMGIDEMKKSHTIPVFAKDNESVVSHQEFIETVQYVAGQVFSGEQIRQPAIRCSHVIKGRIPSAVGKPAKELLEHEKTIYYERMAFAIEIPSINNNISGNTLSLALGGIRAYSLENLYSRKNEEHFKLFIGFQNKVCTNLCLSTDGVMLDVKVRTTAELAHILYRLFGDFIISLPEQIKVRTSTHF